MLISEDCPLCHRTERNDKLRNDLREVISHLDGMMFDLTHENRLYTKRTRIKKMFQSKDAADHYNNLKQIKKTIMDIIENRS